MEKSLTRQIIEAAPVASWYDLLLRKEKYSFYTDLPFQRLIKDVKGELDELLTWIENKDSENIKEEINDVVFNTCQLIQALFKRWLIDIQAIQKSAWDQKDKIYKRQPFLVDQSEKPTDWEHETALFKKLKAKNKPNPQLEILFDN